MSEANLVKSIGKSKLDYFREDFKSYKPKSWSENYRIYHNQKHDQRLTLFYMFDQTKMVILRLLCEKYSDFVIHNHILDLDTSHTLPINKL